MKLTVLTENNTYIDQYYLGVPGLCYYLENGEADSYRAPLFPGF